MQDDDQITEARKFIEEERTAEAKQAHIQEKIGEIALRRLEDTLAYLRAGKPSERSELTRRYAVSITELEKAVAYFKVYVVGQ